MAATIDFMFYWDVSACYVYVTFRAPCNVTIVLCVLVIVVQVLGHLMTAFNCYIEAAVRRVLAAGGEKVRVFQTALLFSRGAIPLREQYAHRDRPTVQYDNDKDSHKNRGKLPEKAVRYIVS